MKSLAGTLRVSILILDTQGNVLSKFSPPDDYCTLLQTQKDMRPKCQECDKSIVERCRKSGKIEQHICHAGLCDLAMSVVKDEAAVAYIVIGRIRTILSPSVPHYDRIPQAVRLLYDAVPFFSDKQLEHLSQLLPQIVLDCTITIEYDTFSDDIVPYIHHHLQEALSVPILCKRYHVSKNTIYRFFREKYSCTVVEFITNARMQQAMSLLTQTEHTVRDIAEQIGIENYTYFCKLFKQQLGMTPTEYRKANHKKPPA